MAKNDVAGFVTAPKEYRDQHRAQIHYQVMCASCGKRATYSPTKEHSRIEAYCVECAAERRAEARRAYVKSFKAAERWLIDPSQFQKKP